MTAFLLNVVASVIGGVIVSIFLSRLPVPSMWHKYWPQIIGIIFVFLWLGGYAVWRMVSYYLALRRWLLECPDTDADAKDDKNLYMRINRLITAKLKTRP